MSRAVDTSRIRGIETLFRGFHLLRFLRVVEQMPGSSIGLVTAAGSSASSWGIRRIVTSPSSGLSAQALALTPIKAIIAGMNILLFI